MILPAPKPRKKPERTPRTPVGCLIEDCTAPAYCRGWCRQHYNRWHRSGDPLPTPETPLIERYWANVDRSAGPDACWPWTGSRNARGYGLFFHHGLTALAHRWGYEERIGPIPEGHGILHRCDNPPCQNDRHWFTGTRVDNIRDMIAKGRNVLPPPPPPGNFRRHGIRDAEWAN